MNASTRGVLDGDRWQAGRLWSLLDMLNFMAWQLTAALGLLYELENEAGVAIAMGHRDAPVPQGRIDGMAFPTITYCKRQAERIEMTATLMRVSHIERDLKTGISWDSLRSHLKVLRETIQDDLTYRSFAYVPLEKAKVLRGLSSAWENIWRRFPGVVDDSSESANCYALGRNTACVFHAMRIAERGLRALAKERRVKLDRKRPIDWGEWQELLNAVSGQAKKIEGWKKGEARDLALAFYRGALQEFQGFKDVYRNHVMHARDSYDEYQALRVYRQVYDFISRLSVRLDEAGHRINWTKVAASSTAAQS